MPMPVLGSIKSLISLLFSQNSHSITLTPDSGTTYTADRTIKLPAGDANSQISTLAGTETLTNKTLTSPTIDTPTINGVTNGSSAASGVVGEELTQTVTTGAAFVISGSAQTLTSITLTAGDWDVCASTGASSDVTNFYSGVSTTTNSLPATTMYWGANQYGTAKFSAASGYQVIPPGRVSVSGSTTLYLIVKGTVAGASPSAYGYIRARRIR